MGIKKQKKMPSMQGPAVQCCLCLVGVFMFLGGLIMMCTGIVLILNYDFFDVNLLPPDLQSEDGKRTVGIILTVFGCLGIFVSVLVSVLYLCSKNKPSRIDPDDISRIPSSARNNTPDRPSGAMSDRRVQSDRDKDSRDSRGERERRSSGTRMPVTPTSNGKPVPGAVEVKHPRHYSKGKRHHRHHPKGKFPVRSRLEEIKEADAISRKTMLGASRPDMSEYNESLRSGSLSSEVGQDDGKTPRIVIGQMTLDQGRPPSVDSGSTSMTSELSKSIDTDRLRREYVESQTMEMKNLGAAGKDELRDFRNPYPEMYDSKFDSTDSLKSEPSEFRRASADLLSNVSTDLASSDSASRQFEETPMTMTHPPIVLASDSENSVISYRTRHTLEVKGQKTEGRISPQVDAPERSTQVEVDRFSLEDSLLNDSKATLVSETSVTPVHRPTRDSAGRTRNSDDVPDFVPEQVPWRQDDSVTEDYHAIPDDREGLV